MSVFLRVYDTVAEALSTHTLHHFKNICVHMDPLKTTENTVVHIPALKIHQKWRRRDGACA